MQHRYFSAAAALICAVSVISLLAQEPTPAVPATQQKQMMKGKGMMNKGATKSGEPSMMAKHEEMTKLVDQVTTDLAALQSETNLATLKTKLAADHAILETVRDHMKQEQGNMKTMMESMKGNMAGTAPTPESPSTASEHKH